MCKLSVIVPFYNREDCVDRCISSLVKQTMSDLEIVAVDDGSSDRTYQKLKEHEIKDDRIRVIRHDVNMGGNAARNTGISNSSGQFVAFLDSDDVWLETKAEAQLDVLEKQPCEVAGVFTGYISIMEGKEKQIIPDEGVISPYEYLTGRVKMGAGSTLMVRRSCLLKPIMFDEELTRFQDMDFVIQLLSKYKIYALSQPLVKVYRYRKTSFKNLEKDALILLSRVEVNCKDLHLGAADLKRIKAHFYTIISVNQLQGCGSLSSGLFYYIKLLSTGRWQATPSVVSAMIFRMTGYSLKRLISK